MTGVQTCALPISAADAPLRVTDFSKPILVLVDTGCGSTCGISIAALRGHPKVQFVGTNSAGNLHFMSPGVFQLPHSKIVVELSPTWISYSPEFDDALGFIPDRYILVPDPVPNALKYLGTLN